MFPETKTHHRKLTKYPAISRVSSRAEKFLTFIVLFGCVSFLLLGVITKAYAATYYVDSSGGNDSNNGTSSTTPWQTVAKVNSSSFNPGDTILFKAGDTWREQLTVPSSGASGTPITFGEYGTGSKPIISGSNLITGWSGPSSWAMVNNATGTATTTAFTNPLTPGSIIIVAAQRTSTTLPTPTDTAGNTYIDAGAGKVLYNGSTWSVEIWYSLNTHSTASDVISDSSGVHMTATEWTGGAASSPVDVYQSTANATTSTSTGQNVTSGIATTTVNGDLIVGIAGIFSGVESTGTGFTQLGKVVQMQSEYLIQSTAGSIAATWNDSTSSDPYGAIMAAFKLGSTLPNVWSATDTTSPNAVYFNDTLGTYEASTTSLTAPLEWSYASNTLYVYSTSSPSTAYVSPGIEATTRSYGISNAQQNVVIQNLQVVQPNIGGVYVTGADTTVRNMTISNSHSITGYNNNSGWGIMFRGTSNNGLIDSNTVTNSDWGIKIWAADSSVSGVVAQRNTVSNIYGDCFGTFQGSGYVLSNTTWQFNTTSYCGQVGGLFSNSGGINLGDATGTGNIVQYNLNMGSGNSTYPVQSRGFVVDSGGNNALVQYNVSYGDYGACLVSGGNNNTFIGNTCYNNNLLGNEGVVTFYHNAANDLLENNIFYDPTSTSLVYAPSGNTTGNSFDYNLWFSPSTTPFHWASTNYSFSEWQGIGQDAHGLNANPLFTNTSTPTLTLQSSSPAIDAGASLGPSYQNALNPNSTWPSGVSTLNQNNNGLGWEMGAYIYPNVIAPTVNITSPTASSTIGGTVSVSATATSSNASISSVQFLLNGSNLGSLVTGTSSPNTYSTSWNTASSTDGVYSLSAVATDSNDNTTTSSSVSVTVRNTPPVRSSGSPTGSLSAGSTSTTLSLLTDEIATCRYTTSSGVSYASMTNTFTNTASTTQSTTVTGLSNGKSYTYYVRCQDAVGNVDTTDYSISFSVGNPPAPNITAVSSSAITYDSATITWTTDQLSNSQVAYGTISGSYTSTTTLADTSPEVTTHLVSLSGLNPSTEYYYVVTSSDGASSTSPENTFTTTAASSGGGGGGGVSFGSTSSGSSAGTIPTSPSVVTVVSHAPTTSPPSLPYQPPSSTSLGSASTVKLINNKGTYYLEAGGVLHGITNPGMLQSYGFTFSDAQVPTAADLALPEGSLLLPADGALVRSQQDPTVYLISDSQRDGFTSAKVFTALGYKFSSVLTVTNPELQALPEGNNLSNTAAAHLDGTDIFYQGTIYWISGGVRYPYPSLVVYNSWHITNDFSGVVPANAQDLQLPVESTVLPRQKD